MTKNEAFALMNEYRMPQHVRAHTAAVARVALYMADKLAARGIRVDREALEHAALLHDLVRVVDFRRFNPETWGIAYSDEDVSFWKNVRKQYAGRHHADVAAEILRERGEETLARLIERHRFSQIERGFDSWEEKLLYYADKRVAHDTVVPLRERLEDGRKRNLPEKMNDAESRAFDEKVFALERDVCEAAGVQPDELETL